MRPTEKATLLSQCGLYLCRRRPEFTLSEAEGLPHTFACTGVLSTPGFGVMAWRVRSARLGFTSVLGARRGVSTRQDPRRRPSATIRRMPTVLRSGPYRFYFYSHEPNEPPHIHVDRDDSSAKFWLDPVQLAANFGFRAHELREIQSMVEEHRAQFTEAWNEFFGIGS